MGESRQYDEGKIMSGISLCCSICKIDKLTNHFPVRSKIARGYDYRCKSCKNIETRNSKASKPKGYYYKKRKDAQRAWAIANPLANKKSILSTRYGISLEDYQKMIQAQNNKCKICNKSETTIDRRTGKVQALSMDHCHKTNKVRGLLCGHCNHAIGKLKDDPAICRSAALYLEGKL